MLFILLNFLGLLILLFGFKHSLEIVQVTVFIIKAVP